MSFKRVVLLLWNLDTTYEYEQADEQLPDGIC